MGYCFDDHETVSDGIKRIALEQIDKAVQCTTPKVKNQDEAVHDTRVAFKKLRALLRLARTRSNDKAFSRENACYRDAARLLADVRDTTATIAAFDKLIEHFSDQLARNAFADLRMPLIKKWKEQQSQKKRAVAEVARMLTSARMRITHWPLDHEGFSALRRGLKRTYERGRACRTQVHETPNVESLHEWRKCIKDLGYQVRLLKPIWPALLGALADELERLADYLSDDHDLALLRQTLIQKTPEDRTQTEALVAMIDQRRSELQIEAKQLGERIYVERPKDFVRRFQAYWRAWCTETMADPIARS